jgi:broad specificity phosphatase PhoE
MALHVRSGSTLVLVRHGETAWSVSSQHTSVTDVPLTETGRREAELIGARLAGREFALALVSPRGRARETAALAGLAADVETDLVEIDYGGYEGLTTPQIREQNPGWSVWREPAPGGESVEQAGERADRVIERALAAGGDVVAVAHGHFLRVIGARWLGLPAASGGNLGLDTGSCSELGFERERRVIWLWNDTSHLR